MGAYDFFQPLGYQVLVAKTSEDDIEPLKKVIKQHKCDGVILSRTLDNALVSAFCGKGRAVCDDWQLR